MKKVFFIFATTLFSAISATQPLHAAMTRQRVNCRTFIPVLLTSLVLLASGTTAQAETNFELCPLNQAPVGCTCPDANGSRITDCTRICPIDPDEAEDAAFLEGLELHLIRSGISQEARRAILDLACEHGFESPITQAALTQAKDALRYGRYIVSDSPHDAAEENASDSQSSFWNFFSWLTPSRIPLA